MSNADDQRTEPAFDELDSTPEAERRGVPREIFFVFAGVNVAVTNLAVGALGIVLGLSLLDVVLVYFLGAILGSACVGLCVLQGQRTGASVMVNARPAFGFVGARILAVFLFVTTAGWFGVNSYFGVTAARSIAGEFGMPSGHGSDLLLLAVLTLLLVLVAVYGYKLITRYERVAFIGMGIALVVVAIGALSRGVDWGHPASVHGIERFGAIAMLVTALGVGWGVSWTPFAHDFGRYVRRDASRRKVFFMASAGMYVGTFFTFSLSAIIATSAASSLDVGKTVEAALPQAVALPVLLVMTLGLLAGQPRQSVRRTGGAPNCGLTPESPPGRARHRPRRHTNRRGRHLPTRIRVDLQGLDADLGHVADPMAGDHHDRLLRHPPRPLQRYRPVLAKRRRPGLLHAWDRRLGQSVWRPPCSSRTHRSSRRRS